MSHITTCTACGKPYEESSEEAANDPNRICLGCFDKKYKLGGPVPAGWDGTQSVFGVDSEGHRITGADGKMMCGCYPECRIDCRDHRTCYEEMPEYWSKQYRAQRYAADVLRRRPAVRQWLESVTRP